MQEFERVYLDKAEDNLAAAQSEFINRRYDVSASRSYFACFQAAVYALIRAGIRPRAASGQWGHDFVQAEFSGQLVNRRRLYPASLRSTLDLNRTLRSVADYATDRVSEVRADHAVGRAESFLESIRAEGGGAA